jgi:hypothetical protein
MIIRKADKDTEAEVLPSQQLLTAMLRYNEEMAKAGVLLRKGSRQQQGPASSSRAASRR